MAKKPNTLRRLAKKNFHVSVRLLDREEWKQRTHDDPRVPRNLGQMRRLWKDISARRRAGFDRRTLATPVSRGLITRRREECAEDRMARFFLGFGNPGLGKRERDDLEGMMDADLPAFDQSLETTHFILRWTNSAAHAADNIADAAIVTETGEHLEAAWAQYETVFGRTPYVPSGATKIEVTFWDIAGLGVASPPDGPISFNAAAWSAEPGIRRPTSAHELFHKLQYAFGYRTVWTPVSPYQWFSEGSASWAEVFMWQRVSRAYKVNDLFSNPDINLFDASYRALPFWLFFDTRQRDAPDDIPLVGFLQKYELLGDEEAALAQCIDEDWPPNAVYGQLDHFFALFSRERRRGVWRQTPVGAQPYPTILGPDGASLNPPLTMVEVPLGSGDAYASAGSVSGLGSDYYHLAFAPDADGQTLTMTITGAPGGDYSYYLVWEKAGQFTLATFPFFASGSFSFNNVLDMAEADALVLIVSGRGIGGAYTVSGSIS